MFNQIKWFGRRPTVKVAQEPGKKVTVTSSTTAILASNDNRASFLIRNTGTVDVYIRFGATATVNDMLLEPKDIIFCDDYTGEVNGIVSSTSGEVRAIEV